MSSTNLYPHIVIGNIQSTNSTFYTISQDNFLDSNVLEFYNELSANLSSQEEVKSKFVAKYNGEDATSFIVTAIDKCSELFYGVNWLLGIEEQKISKETILDKFASVPTSNEFIKELYESLFITTLHGVDIQVVEKALQSLKLIRFLKEIDNYSGTLDKNQVEDLVNNILIILPKMGVEFTQKGKINTVRESVANTSIPSSDKEVEDLKRNVERITQIIGNIKHKERIAIKRIEREQRKNIVSNDLLEKSFDGIKNDEENVSINSRFSQSELNLKLDKGTKEFLQELDIDYEYLGSKEIYHELELVRESYVKKLISRRNTNNPVKILKINDILIELAVDGTGKCSPEEQLDYCDLVEFLINKNKGKSHFHLLGMGWYNVIKQEFVRYETGAIVHNETISSGESKVRVHRNLQSREDYSESEIYQLSETETDMKSTDRFELNKELTNSTSSASQDTFGVGLKAGWGPVSITANASFSSQNASQQVAKTSVKNAREVVQRAVQKIQEKSLFKEKTIIRNEVEVKNTHTYENSTSSPINNFYLAIDKVYKNQVWNLGKKLQIQFTISEPGAHHIYMASVKPNSATGLIKPIHPREYTDTILTEPLISYEQITIDNYALWASVYQAENIPSPPSENITVSKSFGLDYQPNAKGWNTHFFNDIEIPDGYQAESARYNTIFSGGSGRYISGYVGNKYFISYGHSNFVSTLDGETDRVPLIFRGKHTEFGFSIEVNCIPSDSTMRKWKVDMFAAIMGAYRLQKQNYDDQIASAGIAASIESQNPLLNKRTIHEELVKQCVGMFTGQYFTGFDAMKRSLSGKPELDYEESHLEGKWWQFFMQLFEFDNMMFKFYPYIAGADKQYWSVIKHLDDPDIEFMDFLRAGHAKVVVPVRSEMIPHFYKYVTEGIIWNGSDMPQINDPDYMSIIDEIKLADGNNSGTPVGDPWEVTVPTSLIYVTDTPPNNL